MTFKLHEHQFRPGDRVVVGIFNHPDHKEGRIKEVVHTEKGICLVVTRNDGREVDLDGYEDDVRLSPGAAYSYARMAGMDYIHVVKLLRETYELSLLGALEVIAKEANATTDNIRERLDKELELILR